MRTVLPSEAYAAIRDLQALPAGLLPWALNARPRQCARNLFNGAMPSTVWIKSDLHECVQLSALPYLAFMVANDGRLFLPTLKKIVAEMYDADIIIWRRDGLTVDIANLRAEMEDKVTTLQRTEEAIDRDWDALSGEPCIRGTLISAHAIAESVRSGTATEAILANYPALSADLIQMAIVYVGAFGRIRQRKMNAVLEIAEPMIMPVSPQNR